MREHFTTFCQRCNFSDFYCPTFPDVYNVEGCHSDVRRSLGRTANHCNALLVYFDLERLKYFKRWASIAASPGVRTLRRICVVLNHDERRLPQSSFTPDQAGTVRHGIRHGANSVRRRISCVTIFTSHNYLFASFESTTLSPPSPV